MMITPPPGVEIIEPPPANFSSSQEVPIKVQNDSVLTGGNKRRTSRVRQDVMGGGAEGDIDATKASLSGLEQ